VTIVDTHVKDRRDDKLRSAVQSAINASPDIDSLVVTVGCENGTVTLGGEVGSFAERVGAGELVAGIAGVLSVQNNITVRPYGSDWAITDGKIRKAIDNALAVGFPELPQGSIGIDVSYHVVTLTGSVPSVEDRGLIRHIVEGVRGVDFVDNQLGIG
jgi:osmotically-inducible protein OsmY